MDKRNFDAHPLPPAVRRMLAAIAVVLVATAWGAAWWTAGPGNWVPLSVRDPGDRAVARLPPVMVTASAGDLALRLADGADGVACADAAGRGAGR